jgi:hypothetical protein
VNTRSPQEARLAAEPAADDRDRPDCDHRSWIACISCRIQSLSAHKQLKESTAMTDGA